MYTVYSKESGRISKSINCPPEMLAHQYSALTEAYVDGSYEDNLFYILDGSPVLIPESPNYFCEFNWATKQWRDPRTLQDLKASKWGEIKQARDTAELGPFTYNTMMFDGDLNAQRRLAGYISVSKSALSAGHAFAAEFTLANNTQAMLNAQDFVGIELAKVQSVAAAFTKAQQLRDALANATTAEEVQLVTW